MSSCHLWHDSAKPTPPSPPTEPISLHWFWPEDFDLSKPCSNPSGCVWKCCVPLNPMVLLIIIPMKNGYFIGNINPTFSDKPIRNFSTSALSTETAPPGRLRKGRDPPTHLDAMTTCADLNAPYSRAELKCVPWKSPHQDGNIVMA